jgi:hypothetical protein
MDSASAATATAAAAAAASVDSNEQGKQPPPLKSIEKHISLTKFMGTW